MRASPPQVRSESVSSAGYTALSRAIRTAIESTIGFDAMAHDTTLAVCAGWRQPMDRAFKAVEDMASIVGYNLEALVVIVSTDFAPCHKRLPLIGLGRQTLEMANEHSIASKSRTEATGFLPCVEQ